MLVGAGARVNYENEYRSTALSRAVLTQHYAIALFLVQRGARYDKPLFDREGKGIFLPALLAEPTFESNAAMGREKQALVEFIESHQ